MLSADACAISQWKRAAHVLEDAGPRGTNLARQPVIDCHNGVAALRKPRAPALVLALRSTQPRAAVQTKQRRMRAWFFRQIKVVAKRSRYSTAVCHVEPHFNG